MMTRKLNLLQINKVLEGINQNRLNTVTIKQNKKGVHMISYEMNEATDIISGKSHFTIELIKVLREIKRQVVQESYSKICLDCNYMSNKLTYQFELK